MNVIVQPKSSALASVPATGSRIVLLGSIAIWDKGRPLRLPTDAQRLVAFLALRRKRMPRAYVAGTLWMEGSQAQAFGSLRSALWRLRAQTESFVDADSNSLALSMDVSTDVEETTAAAVRLSDRSDPCDERIQISRFVDELLPGWYDEWVLLERERMRQQSLHALEAIATRLADEQKFATAIEAALSAIELDPLRESAHRCLISIHLKEGNPSEALRHFQRFEADLRDRLGITPSETMIGLMARWVATPS